MIFKNICIARTIIFISLFFMASITNTTNLKSLLKQNNVLKKQEQKLVNKMFFKQLVNQFKVVPNSSLKVLKNFTFNQKKISPFLINKNKEEITLIVKGVSNFVELEAPCEETNLQNNKSLLVQNSISYKPQGNLGQLIKHNQPYSNQKRNFSKNIRNQGPICGYAAYLATKFICYGTAVAAAGAAVTVAAPVAASTLAPLAAVATGGASIGASAVGATMLAGSAGAATGAAATTATAATMAATGGSIAATVAAVESGATAVGAFFAMIPFLP